MNVWLVSKTSTCSPWRFWSARKRLVLLDYNIRSGRFYVYHWKIMFQNIMYFPHRGWGMHPTYLVCLNHCLHVKWHWAGSLGQTQLPHCSLHLTVRRWRMKDTLLDLEEWYMPIRVICQQLIFM